MSYYIMFIVALLNLTATALRPINVAVIVKTHGHELAGTDYRPWLKLSINGNWREARFHGPKIPSELKDRKERPLMSHKSDWFEWPASEFSGFNDLDDLKEIIIRADSNDGWVYEDISVFVQDENNNWHVVAMHHDTNRFLIGGEFGRLSRLNEQTVSMNVNKWQQCLAEGNIMEVQLFAATEIVIWGGSDDGAQLIIETSTGHTETLTLYDLDGNDYFEGKTDWWKWSWSRPYRTTQITGIKLKSGGRDGWKPDRVMVVFKTSDNMYQVVAMDRSIGWLDNRSEESLTLTKCPLTPFQYTDAMGYWSKYTSGNGGDGSHHTIRYSFTQTKTETIEESEAEELFRSTTVGMTIGVATGPFKGISASGDFSISNTNSETKRQQVIETLANSVSESTVHEHKATPPDHIPEGEHYALYVWNVFRKSNYGSGANLVSFDYIFKWGACRDVFPNCVSSSYCKDDDCMTCSDPDAVIDPSYQGVRSSCLPRNVMCTNKANCNGRATSVSGTIDSGCVCVCESGRTGSQCEETCPPVTSFSCVGRCTYGYSCCTDSASLAFGQCITKGTTDCSQGVRATSCSKRCSTGYSCNDLQGSLCLSTGEAVQFQQCPTVESALATENEKLMVVNKALRHALEELTQS